MLRPLILLISAMLLLLFGSPGDLSAQKPKPKARKPNPLAKIEDDPKLPRVLLLGDSISIGYTLPTRKLLAGVANVHRAQTNCGPTSRGVEQLDRWLGTGKWDVIHFNWGLHDLKWIEGKRQIPLEKYKENLEQLVARLKKTDARLLWCSTTPVPQGDLKPPRTNEDVIAYNAAAQKIMEENGIATDDLYAFAASRLGDIQRPVNVHFTPKGSQQLAEKVAQAIRSALAKE